MFWRANLRLKGGELKESTGNPTNAESPIKILVYVNTIKEDR
jgi:hypothetical protein